MGGMINQPLPAANYFDGGVGGAANLASRKNGRLTRALSSALSGGRAEEGCRLLADAAANVSQDIRASERGGRPSLKLRELHITTQIAFSVAL